jgi:hypothetical protein
MDNDSIVIMKDNKKSISSALTHAITEHNKLCRMNHKDRKEYLQTIVDDLKKRNLKEHITVKKLMQREQCRHDFKVIRNAIKMKQSSGINHLDIPIVGEENKWERITNHQEIEEKLLERNRNHFGQARNTPFATTNLNTTFGYEGTNSNCTNLIDNNIIPKEVEKENKYVRKFIEKVGTR